MEDYIECYNCTHPHQVLKNELGEDQVSIKKRKVQETTPYPGVKKEPGRCERMTEANLMRCGSGQGAKSLVH